MSSGIQGSSTPRNSGGITGSNAKKINPVYREMMKKRLQQSDPINALSKKEISKILQSNTMSLSEYTKFLRKNPNK
jgi:hypothetical protein